MNILTFVILAFVAVGVFVLHQMNYVKYPVGKVAEYILLAIGLVYVLKLAFYGS